MKAKIKTIDIQAKEWFDKVNGNSYFAGTVTVNYGLKSEQSFNMPFQYGYGDSYYHKGLELLKKANLLDKDDYHHSIRQRGIIVRNNIQRECKKAELKEYK